MVAGVTAILGSIKVSLGCCEGKGQSLNFIKMNVIVTWKSAVISWISINSLCVFLWDLSVFF